jgi:hypothetical protein
MYRIPLFVLFIGLLSVQSFKVNAQSKKFVAPASADAMRNPYAGNADATAKGKT